MPIDTGQLDERTVVSQVERFARCRENIFEFAKYVKIIDYTTNKIIPFEMWEHLRLVLMLLSNRATWQLCVLKSKQIGLSWVASMWALHGCYKPCTVLEFSHGEDEAKELLNKSRFINRQLPEWLQLKVGRGDNEGSEMMVFPDTNSKIVALPSTEDAGVGYTASRVIRDELDFHKFAEQNFAHVKPTVDAGAPILDMSSSKRTLPGSHFKTLYRRAKTKENNYTPLFLPWYVRPGRDKAWFDRVSRDYYPRWLFEQDYPTSEDDALGSIEGLGLFDRDKLDNLMRMVTQRQPVEVRSGTYIWRKPNKGWKYWAGGDAAEGRGGDYSVIWIEGTNGEIRQLCALMHTNQMTPDIFSFHAHNLLQEYGRPLLVMGADAWGGMVLEDLKTMGYFDRIYCTKEKKLGYVEDERNKQQRLMQASLAVRDGLIVGYKPAIEEMFGFFIDKGKYESTLPHDDLVVSLGNATVAKEKTTFGGDVEVENFYGRK